MKKVLNLLLKHVEKIIFAITMIILIVLISIQLTSFKTVQQNIRSAKKEAEELDVGGKVKPVPTINTDVFDMKIEVQEPWMPAYTAGNWSTYRAKGDPRIFKTHRRPPSTLSEPYQNYIEEFGSGSLFDPPLYVQPLDGKNKILGFETTNSLDAPYGSDIPNSGKTSTINKEGDDDDDDDDDDINNDDTTQDFKPATLVRIHRIHKPYLKFTLATVMAGNDDPSSWSLSFKVNNQTEFTQVNKEIKGTGFKVLSVKREMVDGVGGFQKEAFSATVAPKDELEKTVKMEAGKRTANPYGVVTFELIYFYPKVKKLPKRYKDGDRIKLKSKTKTYHYELQGDADGVSLIEVTDDEPNGDEYKLKKYRKSDYDKWKSRRSKKKPSSDEP